MVNQTLVIPLRNEAARINRLFSELEEWPLLPETEIILVDDGSNDQTTALVGAFIERVDIPSLRLLELGSHCGKGAAVRKGMLSAHGDSIVFTDADLPYGLEGVERVFKAIENGADVAVGDRNLQESDTASASLVRRILSTVFRAWVKIVARTGDITDTQCGLKGFTQETAVNLFSDLHCRGLSFDIEIISRAVLSSLTIAKIPVIYRKGDGSSLNILKIIPILFVSAPVAAWYARHRDIQKYPAIIVDITIGMLLFFLVLAPLWNNFNLDGGRDWDQFQADLLSARHAILFERELPFWMPHRAGGHDAFADPQSMWLSPIGLLVLFFDFPIGARIFIALSVAIGAIGAMRLGRLIGFGLPGCVLMTFTIFLSSPAALYTAGGIPQFVLGLSLLPWLILLAVRATRVALIAGGALLGLDLYGGDVNHFIFHALFLCIFGLVYALFKRSLKPIIAVVLIGLTAFIISAPKFIPVSLFAYQNPRDIGSLGTGLTPRLLMHALLNKGAVEQLKTPQNEFMLLTRAGELVPFQSSTSRKLLVPETFIDWVNGGAYVGGGPLVLAAGGFLLLLASISRNPDLPSKCDARDPPSSFNRKARYNPFGLDLSLILALTLVSVFFLWLSFGSNITPSAWNALQKLPVFSALRSPPRLIIYFLCGLGILAALALEKGYVFVAQRTGRIRANISVLILIALITLDMYTVSRLAYTFAFCEPPVINSIQRTAFLQLYAPMPPDRTWYGPPVTPYVLSNKGLVNGYCAVPTLRSALPANAIGYKGEVVFKNNHKGFIVKRKFTARRILIEYKTDQNTQLIINQNWAPGWKPLLPSDLQVYRNEDNRLAVTIPAGHHKIILQYTPPGLVWGILFLISGLPIILVLTRKLAGKTHQAGHASIPNIDSASE